MINKYKILIFDLDDTLIDNLENTRHAFKKMLEEVEIYSAAKFKRWYEIDRKFWQERQDNLIELPEYLKTETGKKSPEFLDWLRAQRILRYFNNSIPLTKAIELNNKFMNALRELVIPTAGVYETLKYLSNKYSIVIATNGPQIAAKEKISKINCLEFIDYVFSADMFGYMKPEKEYFKAIQKQLNNYDNTNYLIIGDSLKSDIGFGMNCGFDTCWYERGNEKLTKDYQPTIVIKNLKDLKNIL